MRDLIRILEAAGGAKRRTTDAEFIQMARAKFGAKSSKLSLTELITVGEENGVQVPTSIRMNKELKIDAHHWNLSGGTGEDVDQKISNDTGEIVDKDADQSGPEFDDLTRLSKAKMVNRLAAQGKLYLFGRKPKGAFFRVPGLEEYTAQLERMLSRELASNGDSSMEEQYTLLHDKVKLIAGGESQFIKSLLITGAPSSGKTFSVMKTINELGLSEGTNYIVKKGRITVLSMYRTFIEQLNGLILFDDCDSVVEDKNGINMLKGALDTEAVREISYDVRGTMNTAALSTGERDKYCEALSRALRYKQTAQDIEFFKGKLSEFGVLNKVLKGIKRKSADSGGGDDEEGIDDEFESVDDAGSEEEDRILDYVRVHLPNKIDFKGRVIFISNMDEDEWDSAILTRALYQNMNFRSDEMLDFIDRIKGSIKTPVLDDEKKQEVMDYLRTLHVTGKLRRPINFRLVQQAFDLALTENWRKILGQM